MVIPWIGCPLSVLLKQVEPMGKAKYVEFTTLKDPDQFPGQKPGLFGGSAAAWPYVEGLRLDEAMNPLTLLLPRYPNLNAVVLLLRMIDTDARSLLQVKVKEIDEASDIFAKLMGDEVEPRRDFIQENALAASVDA